MKNPVRSAGPPTFRLHGHRRTRRCNPRLPKSPRSRRLSLLPRQRRRRRKVSAPGLYQDHAQSRCPSDARRTLLHMNPPPRRHLSRLSLTRASLPHCLPRRPFSLPSSASRASRRCAHQPRDSVRRSSLPSDTTPMPLRNSPPIVLRRTTHNPAVQIRRVRAPLPVHSRQPRCPGLRRLCPLFSARLISAAPVVLGHKTPRSAPRSTPTCLGLP